jgi:hypothetical protein
MAVKIPARTLDAVTAIARRSKAVEQTTVPNGSTIIAQPDGDDILWSVIAANGEAIRGVRRTDGTDLIK